MSENLKKFLELVSKDEALKQKVVAYKDMDKNEAIRANIALAKEVGIELTEADFEKKETNNELSDDELDAVAGGGLCVCAFVGGGGGNDYSDQQTYGCACVGYGQGGDGSIGDSNCVCFAGGAGEDDTQIY